MTVTVTESESRPANRRSLGRNRIVLIVLGLLLAVSGVVALAGGGITLWVDRQQDNAGYFTAGPGRFTTDTYAIAAPSLDFRTVGPADVFGQGVLGRMRLQIDPLDQNRALFVGVGPADKVAAYLGKVNHDDVGDLDFGPFGVTYTERPGGAPATPPAAQDFWVVSDTGTGPRTLTWQLDSDDWAVVIMNADGSAGVRADLRAGISLPVMTVAIIVTFVTGGVLLLMGTGMVAVAIAPRRRPSPRRTPQAGDEG
jgi:hypothetical protein